MYTFPHGTRRPDIIPVLAGGYTRCPLILVYVSYFTCTVHAKRISGEKNPILLKPVLTVNSAQQTVIQDGDVEVRTSDLMISLRSPLSLRKNSDAVWASVRHLYHQSLIMLMSTVSMTNSPWK